MAYKMIYPYTNEVLKEYANHTEVDLFETVAGEAYCVKQATGIIFALETWNFSFYQVMRVFAPNFIVGNPIILKHASNCTVWSQRQ